jgi:hypothetical protein
MQQKSIPAATFNVPLPAFFFYFFLQHEMLPVLPPRAASASAELGHYDVLGILQHHKLVATGKVRHSCIAHPNLPICCPLANGSDLSKASRLPPSPPSTANLD